MIVIEASAMVDALVDNPANPDLLALLADAELHAVEDFAALRIERHQMTGLLGHILELRANFTVSDGAYLVLAQALDAPLVTSDARLREATRLAVDVRLFG